VRLLYAQLVALAVLQLPHLSRPLVVGDSLSEEGGGLQHYHSHQTFFLKKFTIPTSNMSTISRSYITHNTTELRILAMNRNLKCEAIRILDQHVRVVSSTHWANCFSNGELNTLGQLT
jgi:hypothetical protein